MRQLADSLQSDRDPSAVGSLWFRADGPLGLRHEVRNPVQPLHENLDDYPFADYELHTHWVVEKDELVPARVDNLRGTIRHLRIASARGCPYSCAFCNNAALMAVHKGKGPWVRKRSNENVIQELEKARSSFPEIERVNVVDDLFFIRHEDEIEAFADQYVARVNLPIQLDAHPNTVTERKVAAVARMPVDLLSMGIQSGSPDTLERIYHRHTPVRKIVECMELFRKYGIRTEYHYIVTNPYEPDENVIETMRFIANHHHGPTALRIFPLMFYPGTPMFERACGDGTIDRRDPHAYDRVYTAKTQFARHDYLSIWLRVVLHLRNAGLPSRWCHRLINVVTSRAARRCLDHRWFMPVSFLTYRFARKCYKLLVFQPLVRPYRSLRSGLSRDRKSERGPTRGPDLADGLGVSAARGDHVSRPQWTIPRLGEESRPREPGSTAATPPQSTADFE